ncbi:hypothetical protein B0H17DRAFT_552708 [Mycena rosella]|uniref:Protein YOP1 n=1 Tax=Mycena rosella TaxID=1033263 RepID=A0AAD7FMU3_MYCRO|nr:hypothetical protein B0H17DRAFT_552708 [Mycena rosella]
MALGVAILRLAMLFLNIYETMKVLKRPRPSPRNSGQPTIRALSQRKRNMKGCLAVWIVWCCFMLYERMAEGIVSLFIPFYDEVKSLVLLFLILTRARGAEPIFLHIIRPLLKPYTSTVDALFDVARMFGDIAFLLAAYPFHVVSAWWHEMLAHFQTPVEDELPRGLYAEVQQALHSVSYQPPSRRRSSGLVQDEDHTAAQNAARPRVSGEHLGRLPPARGRLSQGEDHAAMAAVLNTALARVRPRSTSAHEIWHPPRSAYRDEEDDDDPPSSVPDVESEESRREREQMEEWRQYPPFPSAYPPTPLPAPSTLPSIARFATQRFSPITEDPPQDFGSSLPSPHEPLNPGSVGGASDEDDATRVRNDESTMATTTTDDDEEEEEEEEDDFDVTLQTPGVPDVIMAPMTRSRAKASSSELLDSASSSTSILGRKRSRDLPPSPPLPAGPRGRAVAAHLPLEPVEDDSSAASSAASSSSADENEEDEDAETSVSEPKSPLVKRRRVASPPSRVQPRRTTRVTSREPPTVAPPPRRAPKADARRPAPAADPAPRRRATADSDGSSVAPQARPARRAAPAKRK